ncbi:serine/threonine-protein kinase HipA [Murinocardiopsis flavida]|uniref:Serine/threonine-protein kinase HipA n=1 Tax=Murinocardiopsis flavida TaxID=645275 RepID=A0A2P8DP84_9ACTN|nr:type II toxin-antitoxin system HipA family toxin [Murinocardiopsis flavida]PSK99015.1 serine/threonine-protein kinase HipA [Murinocardiopsis flavida]
MSERTAGVFLGERRVGTLGYAHGNTWFDYEDFAPDHPVLGQAFEADPSFRRTASGSVPEWFANLLPERGSGLRRIIGRELGIEHPHDFQVICRIGDDLAGAVRVRPDADLGEFSVFGEESDCAHDHPVRFSLAGVQAKFSMRWEGKGLVLPMTGEGGDWIVKLADARFPDVPRNEFAMLTWAASAGVEVPDIRLVATTELRGLPEGLAGSEESVLAVRRFDRAQDHRIHQEDLAQVREVSVDAKYDRASYSGIARVINALCPQDIDEYIRRLAAIVVMGNLDAHLKNWTLRYPDGRSARLSPAYDFVSVSSYAGHDASFRDDRLAFAVNGGQTARLVTLRHFHHLADRAGLDPDRVRGVVRDTVRTMSDTWAEVKREAPVPGFLAEHLDARLASLPLVTDVRLRT